MDPNIYRQYNYTIKLHYVLNINVIILFPLNVNVWKQNLNFKNNLISSNIHYFDFYSNIFIEFKYLFHQKLNWWQYINTKKLFGYQKTMIYFHISKTSVKLFLPTQLFLEKENHSTKYNQMKKKSIIRNTIKVIRRK